MRIVACGSVELRIFPHDFNPEAFILHECNNGYKCDDHRINFDYLLHSLQISNSSKVPASQKETYFFAVWFTYLGGIYLRTENWLLLTDQLYLSLLKKSPIENKLQRHILVCTKYIGNLILQSPKL